jgi:hypothetical protein
MEDGGKVQPQIPLLRGMTPKKDMQRQVQPQIPSLRCGMTTKKQLQKTGKKVTATDWQKCTSKRLAKRSSARLAKTRGQTINRQSERQETTAGGDKKLFVLIDG